MNVWLCCCENRSYEWVGVLAPAAVVSGSTPAPGTQPGSLGCGWLWGLARSPLWFASGALRPALSVQCTSSHGGGDCPWPSCTGPVPEAHSVPAAGLALPVITREAVSFLAHLQTWKRAWTRSVGCLILKKTFLWYLAQCLAHRRSSRNICQIELLKHLAISMEILL